MSEFFDKLREDLTYDEGCKYEIYLDHLGLPTFGIGHLIKEHDPEAEEKVGTPVSKERVKECFEQDILISLKDCKKVFDDWHALPEEVQLIMINMVFNLGYPRFCKFKKMIAAVKDGDWIEACVQMKDSRWYRQVPNRAERLIERMKNVYY